MYQNVTTQHAQQLVAAGVDYIVVDMTNLPEYDQTADAIQLRPFEVLVQVPAELCLPGLMVWGSLQCILTFLAPFARHGESLRRTEPGFFDS